MKGNIMKIAIFLGMAVGLARANGAATERVEGEEVPQWKVVLSDDCTGDWQENWFLDGKVATVENTATGMVFSAGPEEQNHAHHGVLWTKESFAGDIKIEYDYTRMDSVNKWVNILYIQATGVGTEPYAQDIFEWADSRSEPWMKYYFNNMNLLHISYSAYGMVDGIAPDDDYIRCRRYPKTGKFNDMEIKPDSFKTGLFHPGKTYHITAIKKGSSLTFQIEGDGLAKTFSWQSDRIESIHEGRIGLRHMFTRSARYGNFVVSVPIDHE